MKSDLGPQTGSIKDPASTTCAGRAPPMGMSVLGGLGKPRLLGLQAEGFSLACLAAFSYLEEMLTSRTLEMPHCPLARAEQVLDR